MFVPPSSLASSIACDCRAPACWLPNREKKEGRKEQFQNHSNLITYIEYEQARNDDFIETSGHWSQGLKTYQTMAIFRLNHKYFNGVPLYKGIETWILIVHLSFHSHDFEWMFHIMCHHKSGVLVGSRSGVQQCSYKEHKKHRSMTQDINI